MDYTRDVIDFVIGTDESISTRREVSLILGEFPFARIISGSFAEGVYSHDSDIDLMQESDEFIACSLSDSVQNNRYICLHMIPSPQNHGYCMLLCQDRHLVPNDYIVYHEGSYYLSSDIIKYFLRTLNPRTVLHGPCVQKKYGNFEMEMTFCIRCLSWPEVANEWLSRSRCHGWPDDSLIKKVMERSCHVVPIGLPNSITNSLEWRISFSLAERTLVHSFNRTQFVVYCILKRITKEIIGKVLPNIMCSYFIKTVLFHSIESTPAIMWTMSNLQECLYRCIRVLYRFVDDLYCPHYFIRDVNLFKFKINSQNRYKLLDVLRHLLSMNLQHILSCLNTFSLFISIDNVKPVGSLQIEIVSDIKYLDTISIFETLKPDQNNRYMYEILTKVIDSVKMYRSLPKNTTFHLGALLSTDLADRIYNSHSTTRNITQYRISKLMEHLYTIGSMFDVTSGRLRLASFYLMNGNINGCLNVIRCIQNMFSPCVRVVGAACKLLQLIYYRKFMCGRGLSAQEKFRSCVSLSSCYMYDKSNLPLAIRYQIWDNTHINSTECTIFLSPLMHAYFLQSLCYIELRDHTKLENTVQVMAETITDDTLIYELARHNDYSLLGYVLMKQGNINGAVRCHVMSYYVKYKLQHTRYKFNIAILRIMCCLRHRYHPNQGQQQQRC